MSKQIQETRKTFRRNLTNRCVRSVWINPTGYPSYGKEPCV